jgi:cell division septal protein FtsQ
MHHRRRWIAAGVLVVQLSALCLVLILPAFRVSSVMVSGQRLMSTSVLLRVAGVHGGSIFTLDGDAVRARLLALPWVQDAAISTDLPATVHIQIDERAPLLRVRRGGVDTLLAANGASLVVRASQPAALRSLPVLVDERLGSPAPLDPGLVRVLGAAAERFTAVFGCPLAGYQWGADDVLAVWGASGWRAVLGHVDTDAAVAAIPGQLAALAALKGQLDFAHPRFGYVDLENPQGPAVGGVPGLPQQMRAAVSGQMIGAPALPGTVAPPVSIPSPTPSGTPSATPTPVPPSPSPGTT